MSQSDGATSTWGLFSQLAGQASGLIDTEFRLVRAEVSEKISITMRALSFLGAAAVLGLCGLIVLLQACVSALVALGLPPQWAGLVVAVAVLGLAAWLAVKALNDLKMSRLAPMRSLGQMGKNFNALKGTLQ